MIVICPLCGGESDVAAELSETVANCGHCAGEIVLPASVEARRKLNFGEKHLGHSAKKILVSSPRFRRPTRGQLPRQIPLRVSRSKFPVYMGVLCVSGLGILVALFWGSNPQGEPGSSETSGKTTDTNLASFQPEESAAIMDPGVDVDSLTEEASNESFHSSDLADGNISPGKKLPFYKRWRNEPDTRVTRPIGADDTNSEPIGSENIARIIAKKLDDQGEQPPKIDRVAEIDKILQEEGVPVKNEEKPVREKNNLIGGWREFKSNDGRLLVAKALTVHNNKVELLLDKSRKKQWVEIGIFCQADQDYLNEWTHSKYHATTGTRLRCRTHRRSTDVVEHWSTYYGSYDKTFTNKGALLIDAQNLRRSSEEVTVKWYFLGKHANKEGEVFAYGGGEKQLTLQALESKEFITDESAISRTVTLYIALREKYVSGGKYYGWVAITENQGKVTSVQASHAPIRELHAQKHKWNKIFKP
ncbi:MAG: hypothetical protein GY899_05770 [Verrucomicrobiaceae bacterium]|nr:hypothetical protein [Verrucomicrobiaceae bacterium]